MSVEIAIDLALVSAKAPLVALADVNLRWPDGEVIVRRCPIFEKPGQPPWASLPKIPIQKQGKKHLAQLIEMSRDLRNSVLVALLDEYKRKQSENQTSSPGTSDQRASNLTGLRTGDGVREEAPGVPIPGTGEKGPLRTEGTEVPPKAALLNLLRRNK